MHTITMADSAKRAEKALARLTALHPKLIDLGLERSFALLQKLGDPLCPNYISSCAASYILTVHVSLEYRITKHLS